MTDALITALTTIQMHDGELAGHTPDLVMALYMAHKRLVDPSGQASSRRASLVGGSERDRERAEQDREKRRKLRGSGPVGDAIVDAYDRERGGY